MEVDTLIADARVRVLLNGGIWAEGWSPAARLTTYFGRVRITVEKLPDAG